MEPEASDKSCRDTYATQIFLIKLQLLRTNIYIFDRELAQSGLIVSLVTWRQCAGVNICIYALRNLGE